MDNNKSKKIVVITTFLSILVMLIGGTFSYFTASSKSRDNAIGARSSEIRIGLGVSPIHTGYSLIPLQDNLIDKAYAQNCLDDLNRGACLAYGVEIFNYSIANEVIGTIDFTINNISNLSYMVLDENDNIYVNLTHIDSSNSNNLSLGDAFTLSDGTVDATSKKFTILIWLTDTMVEQDDTDSNGSFSALVKYNSSEGGRLTGKINGSKESTSETSSING